MYGGLEQPRVGRHVRGKISQPASREFVVHESWLSASEFSVRARPGARQRARARTGPNGCGRTLIFVFGAAKVKGVTSFDRAERERANRAKTHVHVQDMPGRISSRAARLAGQRSSAESTRRPHVVRDSGRKERTTS